MKELFSLEGKKALVIGGAGCIGLAITEGFLELGAQVVIGDLRESLPADRVSSVEHSAKILNVDVTSEESVATLMEEAEKELGRIDILVNAQGVNYKAPVEEIDIEKWDVVQQVNSRGVVLCCKHSIPYMKKHNYGRIVSLSSVRGIRGDVIGNAAYGASKSVIDVLTKNLALELATSGITANAIGPTVVDAATMGRTRDSAQQERLLNKHPLGRLCAKSDCAALVAFLASDAASYITGHTIYLDGGALAYM